MKFHNNSQMVARLSKQQFYVKLKQEVNELRPPKVDSWDRLMNP